MRTLTDHLVNPANDKLTIAVLDEPGAGGAHHKYLVGTADGEVYTKICFQNGPIAEAGVNGLTHEALLAILADRLRSFQAGPYASVYNAHALKNIESAQTWLQQRTRERMARGVEGTHAL